jgi:hypothetical protein
MGFADALMEAMASGAERLDEAGFQKGQRVQTPLGPGQVAYQRMGPPNYSKPEAVSVVLDAKQNKPGYTGTMFDAKKVKPLREDDEEGVFGQEMAEASTRPLSAHRINRIVVLASKQVKNPMAKDWLLKDEEQTWRKAVVSLFGEAKKSPKFAEVSDKQVDEEIANMLAYSVLTAIMNAKKRGAID